MIGIFLKIINMSMSAGWLVLAVLILRQILRIAPKRVNVLLWGIVAIRLVFPFSIESPFSMIPDSVGNGELVSRWMDDYVGDIDIHHPDSVYYDAAVGAGREPIYDGESRYYVVTKHDQLGEPKTVENTVMPVLSLVWSAGMAVLVLYAVISDWRLRRRLETAVRYRDNIFQSEYVSSPFVLGMIKPKIYLPYQLEEQNLEHVVAHEKAHISRRDHWWKPLGFFLLSVHWFNPMMWLSYVLFCRDMELACDEKVIKELGSEGRADYTQALVACSVNKGVISACPLAFGEAGVKERVKAVLHYQKPAFWIMILAAIACVMAAVCFLTDPLTAEDYFVLTDSKSSAGSNRLFYEISLGNQAMSGEIYVEQWVEGICVKSAPVVMTQFVDSIKISMRDCREEGGSVGTDIQIETNQYGGSLLTYFEHPESFDVIGWAFTGYEADQKVRLASDDEVILAAKVFDNGAGVRAFDCETLAAEPERLQNAAYMIVVRADFSRDPLGVTEQSEAPSPKEVLSLNDVIILSQKGHELTWEDFEPYDYIETGSGLYIRIYEINELFELWIGGAGPNREPMYIYLKLADGSDTKMDIRDGGVTEFISDYGSSKPWYQAEGNLHLGLNAEVIEIDAEKHILYVKDMDGQELVFGDRCAIDCTEAIRKQKLIYVDYETEALKDISLEEFQAGDAVIIALYDSEKQKASNGAAIAEQVQLGTQRMNGQAVIQDPNHNSLFEPTPVEQIDTKYEKEEFVITKLHSKTPEGEWVCGEYTYKYRLEITGRMNQAAKDTTYIVLSNTEDITFEQTWKAIGFSSNMGDYFDPSDAVIVGHKLFS